MRTTDDLTMTILRLVLGVVFFAHTIDFFTQQMHIPGPFALLVIDAEFFGGIGLILGLLGQVAAFGIACNMVVAICMVHWHLGLFANWSGTQKGEGFEYPLLAIAVTLAIMIEGSGALSLDRVLSKSSDTWQS